MIKGVLIDLGGVVYVGDSILPGALPAIERLKSAGLPYKFITNTTRKSRAMLLAKLKTLELVVEAEDLFMPAIAARHYLEEYNLSPHLLVHPDLEEDFAGLPQDRAPALIVGDAGTGFSYEALNNAFRVLLDDAPFLALAYNRHFLDNNQRLSLDAGPFVAALEFASGRAAAILGKPSADFFHSAVISLGCELRESVMIGDDAEADVAGAITAGLQGVLVRTGKYQRGVENTVAPEPTAVADDLAAAVEWMLTKTCS